MEWAIDDAMTDNDFLRAIMADPCDLALQQVYADWLEEKDDARAAYLRLGEQPYNTNYFGILENKKRLGRPAGLDATNISAGEPWREITKLRREFKKASRGLDETWLRFMQSLGCPFRRLHFFGRAHWQQPSPFHEEIGARGWLVTLSDQFSMESDWNSSINIDLAELQKHSFLIDISGYPHYSWEMAFPFMCQLPDRKSPRSARDILDALQVKQFQSEYIASLDVENIEFPEMSPGTKNDVIHNDVARSPFIPAEFIRPYYDDGIVRADRDFYNYVDCKQVWYLRLNSWSNPKPGQDRGCWRTSMILGTSPVGPRLIGYISRENCNYH